MSNTVRALLLTLQKNKNVILIIIVIAIILFLSAVVGKNAFFKSPTAESAVTNTQTQAANKDEPLPEISNEEVADEVLGESRTAVESESPGAASERQNHERSCHVERQQKLLTDKAEELAKEAERNELAIQNIKDRTATLMNGSNVLQILLQSEQGRYEYEKNRIEARYERLLKSTGC